MKKALSSLPLRAALIVLATLICYLSAFRAGMIWDDVELCDNPHMHEPDGLKNIWAGYDTPDYFPLTSTSFWVEARLWGGHAAGYHAVNILLHACSAVMLWLILLQLGVPGAFFAGLLFAVHPVCVASVAWIAERKNTLSLFFCFASLLCWVLHEEREGKEPHIFTHLDGGFCPSAVEQDLRGDAAGRICDAGVVEKWKDHAQ